MVIQPWDDEVVMIDLGGADLAGVESRRSVLPALALAVFTLLTGAGLAVSTNGSGTGDGAAQPGAMSATRSAPADRWPRASSAEPRTSPHPVGSTARPVAAGARAVLATDGHWLVRVSGVAATGVTAIEARVLVGRVVVGEGAVRIDPAVSLGPVGGAAAGDVAPWSADLRLAAGPMAPDDAVATVEIHWTAGSGRSDDVASLVLTLGDGRAAA
jgi:hypothetical protein